MRLPLSIEFGKSIPFHSTRQRLFTLLFIAACACAIMPAQAVMVRYQVSNMSGSGGDPVYSVASDVTFKNLTLTGTFTDNTTLNIPLFDASGRQQTSLDTSTMWLQSDILLLPDSMHGNLKEVTLSGQLNPTALDIMTSSGGSTEPVTVNSLLQGTLNDPMTTGSIIVIYLI